MTTTRVSKLPALAILVIAPAFAMQAHAADTSKIPSKPTSPIVVQSGETYDFGGRTLDGSNITDNGLFRCWGKTNVTIKNVTVKNSPRYAILARGCTNATISNFHMKDMKNSVGGIRFDIDGDASGLKMSNITGYDVGGQAIEIWNANGFTIGDVRIDRSGGSGLLLNNSRNGTVGTVTGNYNNQNGGYATFRVANNNGSVRVKKIYSRNSGRGFFSVSGSRDAVIESVDIASSSSEGIYIQDSYNTKVLSGKARSNSANCRIRGGSGNSINADCGGTIHN
ncbi:MAG: right-handed parallel beta-helix repeat-containing protein [Moraxellaceae bacterium]|nr:right-handed parallel beta-helix repeat-containing protein [Moraxellaceae bacterium]